MWQGCTPGLARHLIYSGVRMNLYDVLRSEHRARAGRDLGLADRHQEI